MPAPYAYVNGEFVSSSQAAVSIFDHGFVTGDGAFETIAVYDNRAFELERHLRRLARTLRGMRLDASRVNDLLDPVNELVSMNNVGTGKIRITYTAGIAGLGSDRVGGDPTVIVAMDYASFVGNTTTSVVVSPWPRSEVGVMSGLKTTSYAENVIALDYAREHGGSEVIFGNIAGDLCEGSGSNIFVVVDGDLITPTLSSGCLAGITREVLLESGLVKEVDIPLSALTDGTVSEAFLTSSLREVQAISKVDSVQLPKLWSSLVKEAALYLERVKGAGA